MKRSVFSIILFSLSFSYTLADTTVYKNPPGPSTDTVTFAWDVVNGTGQCSGGTNYPNDATGLHNWWIDTAHSSSGSSNAYLVLAPPSTNYYFICSENVSNTYYFSFPIFDIVYVNIRSCTDAYGPGYVWNGSTCQVSASPSGNLSLSPASCEISAGNSTCTISGLTWSTANVSSPNVRDANTGSTLSTLSDNASPLLVYIAFGGTTFELRDGSTVLDTRVGSASCASGTIWNGSSCVTQCTPWSGLRSIGCSAGYTGDNVWRDHYTCATVTSVPTYSHSTEESNTCTAPSPSGNLSLSPASCEISAGNSTCTISGLTWSTANVSSPNVRDANTGSTLSTLSDNASPLLVYIAFGGTTFELRDGSTVLDARVGSASCASGTIWNGSTCQVSASPSGNLSLSPASCEISAGNSTCTISGLTWSTANVSSPNVRDANTGSTLSTLSDNASPLLVYIAFGGTTFELRDGSTVLDARVGSASCASGTIWNGSTCQVSASPSGNLSLSPASCEISAGNSTCTISGLTWSTANVSSPNVRDANTGSTLSTLSDNASPLLVYIAFGGTTFELRDGSTVLDTRVGSASCASGTIWNGSTCQVSASPSGNLSLSPASCEISAGNSTCTISGLTWSTANVSSPNVRDANTGSTLSTLSDNASPLLVYIAFGGTTFELRDGSTVLDTRVGSASCASGTIWNGSTCQVSGSRTGNLSVSDNQCLITTGNSTCQVTATWTTTNVTNPSLRNITTNNELSTLANGSTLVTVTHPNNTFRLLDDSDTLDQEVVTASCSQGSFDTLSGQCVNPVVVSTVVTGQYGYTPGGGNIAITCSGATGYRVTRTETGTYTTGIYSGVPIQYPVSDSGNYSVVCTYGTVNSSPSVAYYSAGPPPSSSITLSASPRTIPRASNSSISWTIQHPKDDCILEAKTICSKGICTGDQSRETSALNNKILTEFTDAQSVGDLLTPRTILNSLRKIPTSRVDTDWKTTGIKTFNLKYSTQFELRCGSSTQTTRVLITTTGEK